MIIIAAASINNVIGDRGSIPWKMRSDLLRFKALTEGSSVVMGRKTYDSLPKKPLPDRENIVLTRNSNLKLEGALIISSLERAVQIASSTLFVIGGESLYRESLLLADTIFLTRVLTECAGDTFFPEIDPRLWFCESRLDIGKHPGDDFSSFFETWKCKKKPSTQ